MSAEITHLPTGEVITDEETNLAVRQLCVSGLASSVPEYLTRDKAADLVTVWFPGDRMALASLYRQISQNTPLKVA